VTDASSVSVVADADTLFGGTTRALLIHLDYEGLIQLRWSADILTEMSRALVRSGRRRDPAHAHQNEVLMRLSLPEAEVDAEDVQRELSRARYAVRSMKDAHVAACAMALVPRESGKMVHLLTKNLKDFRRLALQRLGIDLQHPDGFLSALFVDQAAGFLRAFGAYRGSLRSGEPLGLTLSRLALDGQEITACQVASCANAGGLSL
jgi:hypothetical protein